jgi:mitotic spindle assembly checkpoint protein MAD2B
MMDTNQEFLAVLDTFIEFLIVAIHQILYERSIYLPRTFTAAKIYRLPVQQSRHPGLCAYINHAATAIRDAILSGMIKRISVVIFVQDLPREQSVFDISRLSQKRLDTAGKQIESKETFPLVDAEEQLRAVLSKLKDHCVSLEALEEQRTFNTVIETDDASALDPDVRRQWDDVPNIHTEDDLQSGEQISNDVKIWSVKAGVLAFEVWYKSARTASPPSSHTPSQLQASEGSIISSPSDTYGTFPSIQTDLVI